MATSLDQFTQFLAGHADEAIRYQIADELFNDESELRSALDGIRPSAEFLTGMTGTDNMNAVAQQQTGVVVRDGRFGDVSFGLKSIWMLQRLVVAVGCGAAVGVLAYSMPIDGLANMRMVITVGACLWFVVRGFSKTWQRVRPPWGTLWEGGFGGLFVLALCYIANRIIGSISGDGLSTASSIQWAVWAVGAMAGTAVAVIGLETGFGLREKKVRDHTRWAKLFSDWLVLWLWAGGMGVAVIGLFSLALVQDLSLLRLTMEVAVLGGVYAGLIASFDDVGVNGSFFQAIRYALGVAVFGGPLIFITALTGWLADPNAVPLFVLNPDSPLLIISFAAFCAVGGTFALFDDAQRKEFWQDARELSRILDTSVCGIVVSLFLQLTLTPLVVALPAWSVLRVAGHVLLAALLAGSALFGWWVGLRRVMPKSFSTFASWLWRSITGDAGGPGAASTERARSNTFVKPFEQFVQSSAGWRRVASTIVEEVRFGILSARVARS